ncbi:MAG: cytochrome C oxidase subunit IV family protein [Pseudomonadota bacterium]
MSGPGDELVPEGGTSHARVWPVSAVWGVLAGASVLGFLFAEGMAPARIAAIAAILLAAFKVNLVISQYMELEWRHRPLRLMMAAWLAAVTALLLGGFLAT